MVRNVTTPMRFLVEREEVNRKGDTIPQWAKEVLRSEGHQQIRQREDRTGGYGLLPDSKEG
jgi:hypothetical protein